MPAERTERTPLLVAALAVDALAVLVAGLIHAFARERVWETLPWTSGHCGSWSPAALLPFVVVASVSVFLAAWSRPRGASRSARGVVVVWTTFAVLGAALVL